MVGSLDGVQALGKPFEHRLLGIAWVGLLKGTMIPVLVTEDPTDPALAEVGRKDESAHGFGFLVVTSGFAADDWEVLSCHEGNTRA